ncbi:hypothetical protein C2W62_33855 [Candidatus Entotheonella serta]|nr:hypothetical protein C2W62_33855 [Candidatus Entotheonella serta]
MSEWGAFLYNCSQTLPLDAEQLALPVAHIQNASHLDTDLPAFVEEVWQLSCHRVIISCCESFTCFENAFDTLGAQAPQLHMANLKDDCPCRNQAAPCIVLVSMCVRPMHFGLMKLRRRCNSSSSRKWRAGCTRRFVRKM